MDELIGAFSLEGVCKNSVMVNEKKLLWMNRQHWKLRLQQPSKLSHLAEGLRCLLTSQLVRYCVYSYCTLLGDCCTRNELQACPKPQ